MRICPSCNGKYDDKLKKCPACNCALHDESAGGRYCKRCGSLLDDDEIVCRVCQSRKEQNTPKIKLDTRDYLPRVNPDKIAPKSLASLEGWAIWFNFLNIAYVLLGIGTGVLYFSETGNLYIAMLIGISISFIGLFYSMIKTLFNALHDIITALYHIANNKGE